MKLLICGDSFASSWNSEGDNIGWPTLLSKQFDVTNVAQAGCSEYKILLQLQKINLHRFDKILISHTSPYRLYVKEHPIHKKGLHQNSDLIYSDIKEHSKSDPGLVSLVDYFENYLNLEYMEFVHNLICKEIDLLTKDLSVIHSTHFEWDKLYKFKSLLNFNKINKSYFGTVNHYNKIGNQKVYKKLLEVI